MSTFIWCRPTVGEGADADEELPHRLSIQVSAGASSSGTLAWRIPACYPAVNVVHGFTETGSPGSFTFYARPFGEAELLAVDKGLVISGCDSFYL